MNAPAPMAAGASRPAQPSAASRLARLGALAAIAVSTASAGAAGGCRPEPCETGVRYECHCSDGRMGQQQCLADETLGPCACGLPTVFRPYEPAGPPPAAAEVPRFDRDGFAHLPHDVVATAPHGETTWLVSSGTPTALLLLDLATGESRRLAALPFLPALVTRIPDAELALATAGPLIMRVSLSGGAITILPRLIRAPAGIAALDERRQFVLVDGRLQRLTDEGALVDHGHRLLALVRQPGSEALLGLGADNRLVRLPVTADGRTEAPRPLDPGELRDGACPGAARLRVGEDGSWAAVGPHLFDLRPEDRRLGTLVHADTCVQDLRLLRRANRIALVTRVPTNMADGADMRVKLYDAATLAFLEERPTAPPDRSMRLRARQTFESPDGQELWVLGVDEQQAVPRPALARVRVAP
jgi:hypothetical protein